ncbi:cytochrome P450 94A2-like [Solanum dulcamara]|uniref:cytochrome P450 94A2-like n=1 Tax=Solanum dulcamara TaxID=45834 RepID=UPI002485BCCB|nr:cytochrome P450 94A2-like [Solanum dulcamara]
MPSTATAIRQPIENRANGSTLLTVAQSHDCCRLSADHHGLYYRCCWQLIYTNTKVAFGHDPKYLLPFLPDKPLIDSFENRFTCPSLFWKTKKLLNIGFEQDLRNAIDVLREYVKKRIAGKIKKHSLSIDEEGGDFFDRYIKRAFKYNNVVDEKLIIDTGIKIILDGDDTLFSALVWFFWIVSSHPDVEKEIVKEIEQVKDDNDLNAMVKGTRICLHVLAMGRSKELWGSDCEDFHPERWLVKESSSENWKFVPRDPFTYPVFHAGPRTCLGKDIAFMQIKMVVVSVLKRFRLIPAQGFTPIYNSSLTSKMKTGFLVQIVEHCATN